MTDWTPEEVGLACEVWRQMFPLSDPEQFMKPLECGTLSATTLMPLRAVRMTMTAVRAQAYPMVDGEHIAYRSTACLHGAHDYCQGLEGMCGEKIPGKCKFCDAGCICVCHTAESPV